METKTSRRLPLSPSGGPCLLLLVHSLPHVGKVDTVRVEPPFRTHVGMFFTETQIFGAQTFLTFDLLFKIRMIEHAADHVDAAEQLSQDISLLLASRRVATLHDLHDRVAQRAERIVWRCTVDDHVEAFGTKTDVDTSPERIDDVSDLDSVFIELGAISADAAITPFAFCI